MKRRLGNYLQGLAILASTSVGIAQAQQPQRALGYVLPLSDGGSVSIRRSDLQSAELRELVISFTSSTGFVSSVKGSLGRGEFADYGIESLSRDKDVDLFGQCPNVSPAQFFGTIRWTWPVDGEDSIQLSLDGREPRTLIVCGSESEFCASPSSADEFNRSSEGLSAAAVDEYSPGTCFPDVPTSSTPSVDGFNIPIPPEITGELPAPPILSDDTCSAIYASACKEPLISNQNLIRFDISGGAERGSVKSVLGRQRRALARALRSADTGKINSTIKAVVKTFRSAVVLTTTSADMRESLSEIAKKLRAKRHGARAAVKTALRQIRKLEGE